MTTGLLYTSCASLDRIKNLGPHKALRGLAPGYLHDLHQLYSNSVSKTLVKTWVSGCHCNKSTKKNQLFIQMLGPTLTAHIAYS